jgi:signal transduction histidine kinase
MRDGETNPDFQAIFENLPGLYLILDPRLQIIAVSKPYLKATLTKKENMIGKGIFEVFPDNPDDMMATGTSNLSASLQRVIQRKAADAMAIQKYDVRREDGSFEEKHWSPLNSPVLDANGELRYIIHNVIDVMDFVRLKQQGIAEHEENQQLRRNADEQEKIRQTQKLEALGRLVGGIAHDFNTILTLIIAYCDSARAGIETPEEALTQIHRASESAASLIKQLMAFSKHQQIGTKAVNLNSVLANLQPILKKAIPASIKLRTDVLANLGNTLADPGHIEQIIMNLAINAVQAMPRGGILEIKTASVVLDKIKARGNPVCEPGPYVMISVSDTGVGMSAETQARIFEPFYTTKPEGEGVGMGLATVYGIVTQNKGTIWIYSRLGEGTRFEVYLPLTEEKEELDKQKTPTSAKVTGTETILLVEDTTLLRKLFARSLAVYGYKIIEASDGLEAWNSYQDNAGAIDLIITDSIMPNMSGLEFASRVRVKQPKQKIIFLSGYSRESLDDHRVGIGQALFVEKPVTVETLLRRIRGLLDGT